MKTAYICDYRKAQFANERENTVHKKIKILEKLLESGRIKAWCYNYTPITAKDIKKHGLSILMDMDFYKCTDEEAYSLFKKVVNDEIINHSGIEDVIPNLPDNDFSPDVLFTTIGEEWRNVKNYIQILTKTMEHLD